MKKAEINLKHLLKSMFASIVYLRSKFLSRVFIFLFLFLFLPILNLLTVQAKCPENVVPNFLDPNCELNDRLTLGFIINRFLSVVPFVLILIFVGMFLWGIITLGTAGTNSEKVKEAQKIMINAVIALIIFLSLGAILFLISYVTGVDLLSWLGL